MNEVPSANNYSLHLAHQQYTDHHEYWLVVGDHVKVKSECPHNSPRPEFHTLSKREALRNYALMTSVIEGWMVMGEHENKSWHTFVDGIDVNEPLISDLNQYKS